MGRLTRAVSGLQLLGFVFLVLASLAQAQFPPSKKQSTGGKCALIVPTGGRDVCISIEAVNRAFNLASDELQGPKTPFRNDLGTDELGDVILETTRRLAEEFKLPTDAIHAGLPLIDTRKTAIDRVCPSRVKRPKCSVQRYREFSGLCNNLEHAHFGAVNAPFRRLMPAAYADGVSLPRISVTGDQLPTARFVSTFIHRDLGFHDHAVTVFLPAFGQLIDHDMALGAETKDPKTGAEPKCCDVAPDRRHPACWPIDIPADDPFFSLFRRRCLEFVRSATGLNEFCKLGARSTFNSVTSFIDANFVYGTDEKAAGKLRTFRGGQLKSNPVHARLGLKDLLPPKLDDPDGGCLRPSRDVHCFVAGDSRVNQQMMLVALHTIFMREHNRIANELGKINPHWDDEQLYQETRHIIAAMVQHITYNEFLPMVLGKDLMKRYSLLLKKDGHSDDYNPNLDASLPVSFFAAGFRFGHSLIPSAIERWSVSHQHIASKRLSEIMLRPFDIYQGGVLDQYFAGFMNQVSQAVDDAVTSELTNHLFQEPLKSFGTDLASLNMQRGRDHGLPSYNEFREFCGLPRARRWEDLSGAFTNSTLQRYRQTYASVDDIDLWSAGISERPLAGSMVGPVFGCIMGEAFKNLKHGDRFWYENGGFPSSFTLEQLREIRRVKLSRLVCDNSDKLESAQVYVMVLPDPKINPRVPCKSSILPRLNLEHWRDSKTSSPSSSSSFGPAPSSAGFGFSGPAIGSTAPSSSGKPFGPGPTFPKFPSFDEVPSFFPKSPFGGRRSDSDE